MIKKSVITLNPKPPFKFEHTVYSHGWVALKPNSWDKESGIFQRVERLSSGKVVLLKITGGGTSKRPEIVIEVNHPNKLTGKERKEITSVVEYMFRLREDFVELYAICKKREDRWKRMCKGLGRLLRSPSVFEDIVKTICTTNTQWGGTKRMVEALVNEFGAGYSGDEALKAFPTPEAIAGVSFETFSQKARLGYRTDYIYNLAKRVSSGELDLNIFLDSAIPTPDLRKKLLAIKSIGNYACATLLMLLGRYDELPVDSVFKEFVSRKYFNGEKIIEADAKRIYESWGKWKYLAYWFDIWEDFDEEL